MAGTRIDWADEVWNPAWGCTGQCPYCFARRYAARFGMRLYGRSDFAPRWIESNFQRRFRASSSLIFVNSMSDLADWQPEWMARIDQKIRREYPDRLFLMLTKRSGKIGWYEPPPNMMLGASCTDQESYLAESFQVADGPVSCVSLEPLLGPIDMEEMTCGQLLRWIIVGAETGRRKGKVVPRYSWLCDILGFAQEHRIPLWFKDSLRPYWPAGAYFPRERPALQVEERK